MAAAWAEGFLGEETTLRSWTQRERQSSASNVRVPRGRARGRASLDVDSLLEKSRGVVPRSE